MKIGDTYDTILYDIVSSPVVFLNVPNGVGTTHWLQNIVQDRERVYEIPDDIYISHKKTQKCIEPIWKKLNIQNVSNGIYLGTTFIVDARCTANQHIPSILSKIIDNNIQILQKEKDYTKWNKDFFQTQ